MKPPFFLFQLLAAVIIASPACHAEVIPASLFTSHAVLQQGAPVPVWGKADPGESVEVSFLGQKHTTKANDDGHWKITLSPMEPGQAGTLTITGRNTLTLEDVVTGEVWLCSGQSNMNFTVKDAKDAAQEIASSSNPQLRMFSVFGGPQPEPQTACAGVWQVSSPKTAGGFSATAYYFGRELQKELGVPVGLIRSAVGGTPVEAWTSVDAQKELPQLEPVFRKWTELDAKAWDEKAAMEKYEKGLAEWKALPGADPAATPPKNIRRKPVSALLRKDRPGNLFNSKIAPLIPYALRGAIWYQGEANAGSEWVDLYDLQLATLIQDWRTRWGTNFPFAWVQLPEFGTPQTEPVEDDGWVLIREKMRRSLGVPDTGMIVTLGLGEAENAHPKNKQDVGRRLALWALADVYDRKNVAGWSPIFASQEIRGREIALSFDHAENGLVSQGVKLGGFAIAGDDRTWHSAQGRIEGDKVIVSSPEVTRPVAVRYAWAANPVFSLFAPNGLPASPFRTDEFPLHLRRGTTAQTIPEAE